MSSILKFAVSFAAAAVLAAAGSVFAQFPYQWTRHPANPVLSPGGLTDWDATMAGVATVLYHEGIYKMWYEGNEGFGYATSPDGRVWQKYPGNPVLERGPEWYDQLEASRASVVIVDGYYHMWYSCVGNDNGGRIAHATSPDGIVWEKDSANPVMDEGPPGSLDANGLIHPFVLYEEPMFRMWYNGHDGSVEDSPQRILYATSFDGVQWVRNPEAALEPGNPGDWDETDLFMMCVLSYQDTYYMFYTGGDGDGGGDLGVVQIGLATSPDGVHWVKRTLAEPVLRPGDPGAWDSLAVGSPIVMRTNTEFVMWYWGTSDFEYFHTGIATAPLPSDIAVPEAARVRLDQNFPNPFNPRTTIQFTLAAPAPVELQIYDAAGRHVCRLIDGRMMSAGSHRVPWDGRGEAGRELASGVFFYRLEAGDFNLTKRMVLVE